ncbi:Hypothetical predicted protein [Lecanosticta acicola]|uniref:Uncharacterized protein n=1 Tax=Lecanosticta acicola TaxID=111012 RepID=A0AAI9E3Z7_9PEZI|nr:Hypothetical predicted protein [Lecanosticta acicola]
MSKRRASSPCENPIQKKPSMSEIAARAALSTGATIPVKNVPGRKTIRTVHASETQLQEPSKAVTIQQTHKRREPLRDFGPWQNASTNNLRVKRARRSLPPVTEQQQPSAPFRPGLALSNHALQSPPGSDTRGGVFIKTTLLFPNSLSVILPTWPSCFSVNLTPQLGPPLPTQLAEDLYTKYVCSSPLLRPGKLPYFHLGATTLTASSAFKLNFYLILPNAGGPPHAINTGHLSDEVLQTVFDHALIPALQTSDPTRTGFTSWMQAMNEANFKPLKSRRRSHTLTPEAQSERIHCFHLNSLWETIISSIQEDDELSHVLDGHVLIAYGEHDEENSFGVKPTWAMFKRDWENAIDVSKLGRESKIDLEMCLELDMGVDEEAEADRNKKWDEKRRVRR